MITDCCGSGQVSPWLSDTLLRAHQQAVGRMTVWTLCLNDNTPLKRCDTSVQAVFALNCCSLQLPSTKQDACESPGEFKLGNLFFYKGTNSRPKEFLRTTAEILGPVYVSDFLIKAHWFLLLKTISVMLKVIALLLAKHCSFWSSEWTMCRINVSFQTEGAAPGEITSCQ